MCGVYGSMSDFLLSIFISIGIVTMALAVAVWLTIRRKNAEKARGK